MYRVRVPEIVLGALLAVAILAIAAAVHPSLYQTDLNSAHANPDEQVAEYTEWLAGATFLLAFSTFGLWLVTWLGGRRQSRDMAASIAVATRAAENAEQALTRLEVPHVYPIELSFRVDEDIVTGVPRRVTISFSLKNFGRSPAFLNQARLRIAVVAPRRIIFRHGPIHFMVDDVIGDKETYSPLTADIPELLQYCHRIRDGALRLSVFIAYRFDDAMRTRAGHGMWYVWNPRRYQFFRGRELWSD